MPSKSPAQRRLMAAVAHDPDFAAKTGIKQAVGRDFMRADKRLGDTFARPSVAARASHSKHPLDRRRS